jgi:hypothetical protein
MIPVASGDCARVLICSQARLAGASDAQALHAPSTQVLAARANGAARMTILAFLTDEPPRSSLLTIVG